MSDWLPVPPMTFEISNAQGAYLHFTTESVLAPRIANSGVLGFRIALNVSSRNEEVRLAGFDAYYSGFATFRNALRALRRGGSEPAVLDGNSVFLRVDRLVYGPRDGIVCSGSFRTGRRGNSAAAMDMEELRTMAMTKRDSGAAVGFAFPLGEVDPPDLDRALTGLDEILAYLRAEGFEV